MLERYKCTLGFEPLRAEPNGFLVHLLNHSDTVSYDLRSFHGSKPGESNVLSKTFVDFWRRKMYQNFENQRCLHALVFISWPFGLVV